MLGERNRLLQESDVHLAVKEASHIIEDSRRVPFSLDKASFESLHGSLAPSFEIARQNSENFNSTNTGMAARAIENSKLDEESAQYRLRMSMAQLNALTTYSRYQRVDIDDVVDLNEAFVKAGGKPSAAYINLLDSLKKVR